MIRNIIHIEKNAYRDDWSIANDILVKRGNIISIGEINSAEVSEMVDGESRIDSANSREVVKANGKLFKRIVNSEGSIVLAEIGSDIGINGTKY